MKSKDLIAQLRALDPSGEIEVVGWGNYDIHFAEKEPAYYDGAAQVLVRDESKPGYNIVGAKFLRAGSKITLHHLSIEDALVEDPDLPVLTGTSDDEHRVTQWRNEAREANEYEDDN